MRARVMILAVVLCAALTACSDDGDEPKAKGTESPSAPTTDTTTVDCAKFSGTSQKLADAQAALYGRDPDAQARALTTLTAEFDALKKDAPATVDAELDTLIAGFEEVAQLLEDPTAVDQQEFTDRLAAWSEAGQKVTAYIQKQC